MPVKDILGTARTGFGCLNEHEFVLLGGRLRAWTVKSGALSNSASWEEEILTAIRKGTPP